MIFYIFVKSLHKENHTSVMQNIYIYTPDIYI